MCSSDQVQIGRRLRQFVDGEVSSHQTGVAEPEVHTDQSMTGCNGCDPIVVLVQGNKDATQVPASRVAELPARSG